MEYMGTRHAIRTLGSLRGPSRGWSAYGSSRARHDRRGDVRPRDRRSSGYAAYASVQGGRLALIATAAKELAPLGVRVNGVALGHAPGEDRLSDAADLAAYLLSDAADGLVGEVLAPITDNER